MLVRVDIDTYGESREKAREHIRGIMAKPATRPPQALACSAEFRAAMRSWCIAEPGAGCQIPSDDSPDAEEA